VRVHSHEEMIELGRRLGAALTAGDVLGLTGDLGAGKTVLVKGLVLGLGGGDDVTSPTFTLVHTYRGGRLSLLHVDLYRLVDDRDLETIGLEEQMAEAGATAIEWIDRFPTVARRRLDVDIHIISEDEREVTFTARGVRAERLKRTIAGA
jgi:tRNA threonylcarbamoyladenosine biosynthesis protein TsaE